MKKRVVILSAFLTPLRSGAEACAEEVALKLADRYDITIVTARMRSSLPRSSLLVQPVTSNQKPVTVIRVGLGLPIDKWLYPLLAPRAAKKLRPDIIHAVLETFAGLALHFCQTIPHAKRILTLQTTNRNFLRRPILRSPHAVTAISEALTQRAATYGRTDVTVIPNGIPYKEIRAACEKTKKVPGRILFVGRLERMKGVDTLIQAVQAVQSLQATGYKLHIVGEGSERSRLERMSSDGVRFLGRLDGEALFREYAEAEIFCGLSRSEAMGNVFLEAQAAGCAVIGTRVGGIPEIIKDGETGILVQPDNRESAASALKTLLNDPALRARLTSSSVVHAEQYDWSIIAKKYEEMYRKI